jgi:hypothetical protein
VDVAAVKRVTGVVVLVATLAVLSVPVAPDPPASTADRATVTVHGRAGTFGGVVGTTPSGQGLATVAVPGWGVPAGRQFATAAVAGDGTVLMAGVDHVLDLDSSAAADLMVGAYDPAANRYVNVPIEPVGRGRRAGPAPSVTDLEPVAGGRAVAFTTRPGLGGWPAFGVLTEAGGWRVDSGPGWTNQWTAAEVPGGLGEMATFPASRDLIVAHHDGGPGASAGSLVALRLTEADGGRFRVSVRGRYRYPAVRAPGGGGGRLKLSIRDVVTDPTGRLGDERFAVNIAVADAPYVLQEFSYDAGTGRIRPVSAPLLPGDRVELGTDLIGYGVGLYDDAGNLWVSRLNAFHGGKLAVYARTGNGRKTQRECRYDPARPMAGYVTRGGGRLVWGRACRPDYDILQAQHLLGIQGLAQDRASGTIVALALTGHLLPIRVAGSGRDLRFEIGNLVDLGRKLLPTAPGNLVDHRLGGIDSDGRVWITGMHARPAEPAARLDQWLYSVDLTDLFAPAPVRLPDVPGRQAVVQAERSLTTSTRRRRGEWAAVDIDSGAYVHACLDWPANVTCGYDGVPGNGYVLGDESGYGQLRGSVTYRIDVPAPGRYRVGYRAVTFRVVKRAKIVLTAAGSRYGTPIDTRGAWRTVWADGSVALPAGVQEITLSVPTGGGGWALNLIMFERA